MQEMSATTYTYSSKSTLSIGNGIFDRFQSTLAGHQPSQYLGEIMSYF